MRAGLRVPLRLGAAVGSGLALVAAFPPYDLPWLAPIAVAVLTLGLRGCGVWAGGGLGLLFGLSFFIPLLHWSGIYVGAAPWVLLAASQALYLAVLGAATALVTRARWWPLWVAALWVGEEFLRTRWPFGGFPWGRLAFSQPDLPAVRLATLGGAPLVTFAVALIGALLAAAVVAMLRPRPALGRAALAVAGAAAVAFAGAFVPIRTDAPDTATVAIVQGNVPRLGLDFNAQRQAVLDNHVDGTIELAQRVTTGELPRPQFVVWPENASDIDPIDRSGRRVPGSTKRRVPSACRSWLARCSVSRSRTSATWGWSGTRKTDPVSSTSSGIRCRSRSTSRCGALRDGSRRRSIASPAT